MIERTGWRRLGGKRALQVGAAVLVAGGAAYYFLGAGADGGPVEYRFEIGRAHV